MKKGPAAWPGRMALAVCAAWLAMAHAAAAAPIGATAVYVEGEAMVVRANRQSEPVAVGTALAEGDTVRTSANGVVEIEFDTKDLTRIGPSGVLVIKSLSRSGGSTFSVFSLVKGMIKSSVAKLASKDSRFEYHTTSAVAGVAGTPPFIVEVHDNATTVDLLGREGDPGAVYVMGTDKARTMVSVMPGTSATVEFGRAPAAPEPTAARRTDLLKRIMTFKSRPEPVMGPQKGPGAEPKAAPPAKEPDAPPPPANKPPAPGPEPAPGPGSPSGGINETKEMVMNSLAPAISTQIQQSPAGSGAATGVNPGVTPNMGSVGADGGTKAETDKPPPFATGKISLEFK